MNSFKKSIVIVGLFVVSSIGMQAFAIQITARNTTKRDVTLVNYIFTPKDNKHYSRYLGTVPAYMSKSVDGLLQGVPGVLLVNASDNGKQVQCYATINANSTQAIIEFAIHTSDPSGALVCQANQSTF